MNKSKILFLVLFFFIVVQSTFSQLIIEPTSPLIERCPPVQIIFDPTESVVASPVLCDNCLYVGTTAGKIYTIDARNGVFIGQPVDIEEVDVFVGLVTDENSKTLYAVTSNGSLYAYDIDSKIPEKKPGWPVMLNGKVSYAPTLLDEWIYVGSEDGLYAVDSRTKNVQIFASEAITSSPWVLPTVRTVCFGTQDNELYGVPADYILQEKWSFSTVGEVVASASKLFNGVFYVADELGNVYAIDQDGQELWTSALSDSPVHTALDLDGNTVNVATQSGDLYALDRQTGESRHVGNIDKSGILGSFLVGKYFVVVADDGKVHGFEQGKPRWIYREINSTISVIPTANENFVYIISESGKLFVLELGWLD